MCNSLTTEEFTKRVRELTKRFLQRMKKSLKNVWKYECPLINLVNPKNPNPKHIFFSLKEKLTKKISTTNFFACVFPALSYPLPTWNWMTSLMSAMAWECMLSSAARAWSPPSLPPPPPPPTRPTNSLLDKLRIVFVLWKEIQDNTNTYKASFTCLNVFKKIDRICR